VSTDRISVRTPRPDCPFRSPLSEGAGSAPVRPPCRQPPRSPLCPPPCMAHAATMSCLRPTAFRQHPSEAHHLLFAVSHRPRRLMLQLRAASPLSVSPRRSPLVATPPPSHLPPSSSCLCSEPVSPAVSHTCAGRCRAAVLDLPPPEPALPRCCMQLGRHHELPHSHGP
jgi:hypothetical protein